MNLSYFYCPFLLLSVFRVKVATNRRSLLRWKPGLVWYFPPWISHVWLIISLLADGKITRLINPGCTASLCYLVIYCALSHVSRHKPDCWEWVGERKRSEESSGKTVKRYEIWRESCLHNPSDCQVRSVYKGLKPTYCTLPLLEALKRAEKHLVFDITAGITYRVTFQHEIDTVMNICQH